MNKKGFLQCLSDQSSKEINKMVRYLFSVPNCGDLKLGLFLSDDYLEVEIVSGRDLPNDENGCPGKIQIASIL